VLREEWRRQGHRVGLSASRLDETVHQQPPRGAPQDSALVGRSVLEGFERPFLRRDLLAKTAGSLVAGAEIGQLEASIEQVLRAAAEPVTPRGAMPALRMRGGPAIPPTGAEPAFVSHAVAELGRRAAAAVAGAPPLAGAGHTAVADGALLRVGTASQPAGIDELIGLDAVLQDAVRAQRPIHLVAATTRGALRLESLFGGPVDRPGRTGPVAPDSLVVAAETRYLPVRFWADLIEQGATRSATVVVVELAPPRRTVDSAPVFRARPAMAGPAVAATRVVGGVTVDLVTDLRGALGVLAREEDDPRSCVVTSEPSISAVLGRSVSAERAGALLAARPEMRVVVLGSARVLGGGLAGVEDARRRHVVVTRGHLDPDPTGRLLEIAEPRHVQEQLGRPPADPSRRARWRRDAVALMSAGAQLRGDPSRRRLVDARRERVRSGWER
jgi:hypothetical protein